MTFSSSGTANEVQAALGISSAQIAIWEGQIPSSTPNAGVSLTNFPVSLQHGAIEGNWPDPGLINEMNVIWNQTNYTYRI